MERIGHSTRDSIKWEDSAYHMVQIMDYYYGNNMRDSMALFAPKAMDFCQKHEKWRYYYKIWANCAMDMVWSGLFMEAVDEAKKMQEDALSKDHSEGLMYAYQVLGIAYSYQKNMEEAIQCFKRALEQCEKVTYPGSKFALYNYYTTALCESNKFATMDSVLTDWKKEVDAYPVDTANANADVYANWHYKYLLALASYMIEMKQYDGLEEVLDSATYYEEIDGNYPSCLCQLATIRYQFAMARGDFEEALRQADRIIEISEDIETSNYILAFRYRSKAQEALGNYKEALINLQQHQELNDSILAAENSEQLNTLNKRFEVNELKMQGERDRMKAEGRQMLLVVILTIFAFIALILFVIVRHRATVKFEKEHKKLVEAYEQLEIANAKAKESSQMKSNFIQQISHEINTPLNILSGFTQVITMPGVELNDKEKEEINNGIMENTGRISELVNKIIDLADTNSQIVIERNDTVEIAQIANDAIHNSGIMAAKHLTFDQQIPAEVANIVLTTNHKAAARALTLILDNARKFTAPAEAEVKRMGEDATWDMKHALLTVHSDGSQVCFTVEDTGISIPPKEAEHIFEEFVQLDDYYDGTGIGLTVARSIVRKLGGDITLDTTYKDGARFVMTLPL
ncbi:MAG: tetratricopeptide repeat protein [Bacteroidaceae bacterium]|nr:tetratricopeptide repeat protein [Bacteroidaceae bacterium]